MKEEARTLPKPGEKTARTARTDSAGFPEDGSADITGLSRQTPLQKPDALCAGKRRC